MTRDDAIPIFGVAAVARSAVLEGGVPLAPMLGKLSVPAVVELTARVGSANMATRCNTALGSSPQVLPLGCSGGTVRSFRRA